MARPRLPEEHHKLVGSTYRNRSKTAASQLSAGAPRMPSYLSTDGRKEWRKLLPLLMERGSLTAGDSQGLALHCETFARWIACQKQINEEGITQTFTVLDKSGQQVTRTKPHVCLRIAQDCERALRVSLASLGLTPQSREKIVPTKPIAENKVPSAFELMTKGK